MNHIASKEYKTQKCTSKLKNCFDLYEKMKNIKNVLVEYDKGNKSGILQYELNNKSYSEGEPNEKIENIRGE